MSFIECSVGIIAHNEAANIGQLLQRLREQELTHVAATEFIVVASGCTDDTEAIVRAMAAQEPRIHLLVQAQREGKASAINLFLQQARAELLVLSSADLLPEYDTLEALVRPFANPQIGLTASHPVPVNDRDTFMGFAAHLLWELHHEVNLSGQVKAGELIAFRRVFARIPPHTAVDEASIEPLIRGQGYQVHYVPEAIVYNKGPETVADFLRQRRRIHAGHLTLQRETGYAVSTFSGLKILPLFLQALDWRPKRFIWQCCVAFLEGYGRWLGTRDFKRHRPHTVWEVAKTTKTLEGEQVTG